MSGPDYYGPSAGYVPPPGQDYDPNYHSPPSHHAKPAHSSHHQQQQQAGSAYDPNYFPPPPREEYRPGEEPAGRNDYDAGYDHQTPDEYGYAESRSGERPYAPSDLRGNDGNALAPYDEEKAEAGEWRQHEQQRRAHDAAQQQQQQQQQSIPPPPSDYELGRRRYDSRDRYDDRRYDDRRYDSRDRYDERDRRERRRRDSRQSDPKSPSSGGAKDFLKGRDAQLLGGAAGGLLGHELGGGILETLGGAAIGAIGAKFLEKEHEKRRGKKITGEDVRPPPASRRRDSPGRYESSYGGSRAPLPGRSDSRDYDYERSRSRGARRQGSGRDDDRYYEDEYSPSPPRR